MIFREVGRVCEELGITYFLDSGNLLGAVRHKSDIPWDDDADIAMTRSDFEIFRSAARDKLSEGFAYVEPADLGEHFYDFIPRVVLLDSQLRKDSPEEQYYGNGIYNHMRTDIFILDDVSDSAVRHKLCYALLVAVYGMCMGHRYSLELSEYSGAAKAAVVLLSKVGRLFKVKTLLRWYERISLLEKGKGERLHRCYYSNGIFADLSKVMNKEWFSRAVELPVDGELFPCPVGYKRVLETMYGDYMTPPPDDQITYPHSQSEYVRLGRTDAVEKQ